MGNSISAPARTNATWRKQDFCTCGADVLEPFVCVCLSERLGVCYTTATFMGMSWRFAETERPNERELRLRKYLWVEEGDRNTG